MKVCKKIWGMSVWQNLAEADPPPTHEVIVTCSRDVPTGHRRRCWTSLFLRVRDVDQSGVRCSSAPGFTAPSRMARHGFVKKDTHSRGWGRGRREGEYGQGRSQGCCGSGVASMERAVQIIGSELSGSRPRVWCAANSGSMGCLLSS